MASKETEPEKVDREPGADSREPRLPWGVHLSLFPSKNRDLASHSPVNT